MSNNNIIKGVFLVGLGATSYGMLATFVKLAYQEGFTTAEVTSAQFIYGIIGLSFSVWMMNFIMIQDWPQDIGGKPSFNYIDNMPAFVPIMFELTVFFAAHLMVITFYMRSKLWPFKQAENPDVRTTDDHFLMEVGIHGNEEELVSFFTSTGAVEVKVVEKH